MFLRLFAPACALAALLLCFNQANAQTDSAYYNLGRVKLLKSATQHVTVKAEDLQKFPFANLSEAVNVWFSGYFSNSSSLIYVVDGNLATDVNQYPIYDIEEITLVQNAVTQLNGVSQQQQIIVVTTKRNRSGNSGITVAGQTNLIGLQTNRLNLETSDKNTNELYHQYHLSAYKNSKDIHFGASANYLQDVLPGIINSYRTNVSKPQIKRSRFNGYFNTQLWKGTVLDVTAGYVPQNNNQELRYNTTSSSYTQSQTDSKENLFNGSVNITSQLLPGLTNQVRAVYNNFNNNVTGSLYGYTLSGTATSNYNSTTYNDYTGKNFVIYDDLRYTKTIADWTLSPAINFNYRNVKTNVSYESNNNAGNQYYSAKLQIKTYLLTPTLALTYRNLLDVTGGLLYILNNSNDIGSNDTKKTFPFVSATANVSRFINATSNLDVKVYGSYAESNRLNDSQSALSNVNPYGLIALTDPFAEYATTSTYIQGKTFKTLALGISASLFKNKLEVSYNYENRNSFLPITYVVSNSSQYYTTSYLTDAKYKSHRAGVAFNLLKQDKLTWKTQLNATNLKQQITFNPSNMLVNLEPYNKFWAGGWTNRLQYKNLLAGIDVQYLFGKNNYPQAEIQNLNSFALQNVYAGWQIKTAKLKSLEVFANGRNLIQNKNSILPEYRRYFGLGVQAGF